MTISKRLNKPLSPLFSPKASVPFAIQYTLDGDLGPNQYEEFWFDSGFNVIKPWEYNSMDDFIKHRYQKGIIYGPRDLEITYPGGLTVIAVSTTEQFRPGEDNDGSPLSNQDSDADGIPDDADSDVNDPNVPYPDLDEDGVHVNVNDPNSDPDDNNPDDPFLDVDQDGYRSNIDPDDNDPNVIPNPPVNDELKIQAEYVILSPEPTIFEGVLATAAGPGTNGTVNQVIPQLRTQFLYIQVGAYKVPTNAPDNAPLIMRGTMRFAVGSSVSNAIPWDASASEMEAVLKKMSALKSRTVTVNGTIPDIISGTTSNIEVTILPPVNYRVMLWGTNSSALPGVSMVPNISNGGIPAQPYRYAFKCRTKHSTMEITTASFSCYNGSQFGAIPAETRVMCRRISGNWHIIYP